MNHKILIVESDPPSASRTVRALRNAGFRVVAPASATTALATFDRIRPDLVLVGRSLPDNGGVALCQEIKKTPHGGRTPVALLLDNVEIDLPPMAELGWDRLIENATSDNQLVAICRQLIETRGKPLATEATTESGQAAQLGGDPRSLEDVIDEVLTFEHEQSIAHLQRPPAQPVGTKSSPTAPATPKPAAAPERAVAVAARAPQADRPRFQTAALVAPKPEASEAPRDEPTPRHSPPAPRRWWVAAVVGLGAVAIAAAVWVGLSGGSSPSPDGTVAPSIAPPATRVPSPLPITAPVAMTAGPEGSPQAGTGTFAAGVAPLATEPAPETVKPEPVVAKTQPKPAPEKPKPEPVVAKTQPKPAPEKPKPEPVVAKTQPKPAPEKPEPVVAKTQPKPAPEKPKPEPVVAKTQPKPAPEKPKPEPVVAKTQPKPAPEKPKPEPVVAKTQPEPAPEKPKPEPVAVETQPEPTPEPPEPEAVEPEPAPEPELVAPVLLQRVEPTPSPKALKSNRGASVVLRLLINEQGSVIRVVVDQGIPGSELEAAAVNAVLRWKYRPATRGGAPIQQWVEARFTFE